MAAPRGRGLRNAGTPGCTSAAGLGVIAASENVRLAGRLAKVHQQLRISFGIIAPERGDFFVRVVPGRDSGAPVTEDGLDLRGRAAVTGNGEHIADGFRQRVGHWIGRIGDGEPETAQIVVVKITAPVRLIQVDDERCATGNRDGLSEAEYSFARLIAESWADIHAPCGGVLAIDGELDGPSNFNRFAFGLKRRGEWSFGRIHVRGGGGDLHFNGLDRRVRVQRLRFHAELGEREHAIDTPAGTAARQVGVCEHFKLYGSNLLELCSGRESLVVVDTGIALRQERSIVHAD